MTSTHIEQVTSEEQLRAVTENNGHTEIIFSVRIDRTEPNKIKFESLLEALTGFEQAAFKDYIFKNVIQGEHKKFIPIGERDLL